MNIKFGRSQSHTPEDIRTSDVGFRSLYSLISISYYCLEQGLMPLLSLHLIVFIQFSLHVMNKTLVFYWTLMLSMLCLCYEELEQ